MKIDYHSHVLPGLDDGATDLQNAVELVSAMKSWGFEKITCTPHINALYRNTPDTIGRAFDLLQEAVGDDVMLAMSAEYRLVPETWPEVLEKMRQAEDLHQHISEESVRDLQRVDVSNHPYRKLKRLLDVVISATGLIVLAVPMLVIAVIVMIDNPGPAIFSQYRVGLNGKRFKLYKFRSMRRSTPKYLPTGELEDPKRYITKSGKLLRKLSLVPRRAPSSRIVKMRAHCHSLHFSLLC